MASRRKPCAPVRAVFYRPAGGRIRLPLTEPRRLYTGQVLTLDDAPAKIARDSVPVRT